MKVSEVMSRGVRIVSPDTALSEVAAVMCLNHIAGMLSLGDVHKALFSENMLLLRHPFI